MAKFDLKITQKTVDEGKIALEVTVPASVTSDIASGAAVALAMQNKIDLSQVEVIDLVKTVVEQVGKPQYQAFLNNYTMVSLAPYAVAERSLEIIMDPAVSSSEDVSEGKDFHFRAVVTPKPHFELSSYEPVTIKLPRLSITEAEIDEQLAAIAERFTTSEPDAGAYVKAGDDLYISIETTNAEDNTPVPTLTAERRAYTLGDGFLPTTFDDHLMGALVGETREFGFELPGMEDPTGGAGKATKVTTKVCVLQIARKAVPTLDDAWVVTHMPEAKTLEGLRERVREQGLEYKTRQLEDGKLFLTATELAKRLEGFIPDEIYAYTQKEMVQNLQAQIEASGMKLKDFIEQQGIPEQQFSMQMMLETRERLRQSFSLDALARHLKLTVGEEDIADTLARMAPGNEAAARREFEGTGRGYLLEEAALRTKANKWLVDHAVCEYID